MKNRTGAALFPALIGLSLAGSATAPRASEFERHFSLNTDKLYLASLVGSVRIEGHDGSTFEIDVAVRGKDASADRIAFDTEEGPKGRFSVQFPVKESNRFVYPEMGKHSSTTISPDWNNRRSDWLSLVLPFLGGDRIRVSGGGNGLEIWADLSVKVPRGKGIEVRHGVGGIEARGLEGDALLDNHDGAILAHRISGNLLIDTGSGNVEVEEVAGDLNVDTGSGNVGLSRCRGHSVLVDTGSGAVEVAGIDCDHLDIDTGSGNVQAGGVAANSARVDTGSGWVRLDLDRVGKGSFLIDTGSGSIDLRLPPDASADVAAETGSGAITWRLENVEVRRDGDDEVRIRVGNGDAEIRLDTGSGAIRIHH